VAEVWRAGGASDRCDGATRRDLRLSHRRHSPFPSVTHHTGNGRESRGFITAVRVARGLLFHPRDSCSVIEEDAMNRQRIVTAGLIASLAIGSLAPAAMADRYEHARYRGGWGRPGGYTRVVYRDHGGSALGAGLVGLVGGLALGALITNAHSHPTYVQQAPPPVYYNDGPAEQACVYEDPWTRDRYTSLDAYMAHTRGCEHARVVRVLDARDGDCLQTLEYHRGHWSQCDPDQAPGYDDGGGYYGQPDDRSWQDEN
jgi:hypothetical protein